MNKTCTTCNNTKPVSDFYRNKRMSDGFQTKCKLCMKSTSAEWYRNNRSKAIKRARLYRHEAVERFSDFKDTLSCSRCDEDFNDCLEFHHSDPSKKDFQISDKVRSLSWDALKKEIDVCVVLCKNCHAKEHFRIRNS